MTTGISILNRFRKVPFDIKKSEPQISSIARGESIFYCVDEIPDDEYQRILNENGFTTSGYGCYWIFTAKGTWITRDTLTEE